MIFNGIRLARVLNGLYLAKDELHNMIATCPDVNAYEADLLLYEAEKEKVQKLIDEIERKNPGLMEQYPINL